MATDCGNSKMKKMSTRCNNSTSVFEASCRKNRLRKGRIEIQKMNNNLPNNPPHRLGRTATARLLAPSSQPSEFQNRKKHPINPALP
mmetsp:Transcript_5382/g.8755  ORF Transcript_5382/g.8755 Transcript_5382/m.8755 type:complete len:87 (-) Transcript_5382:263-523(-)